ncbi:MAG TPA: hypothetical protein VGB52_10220 [Actinomycetota bacterium]
MRLWDIGFVAARITAIAFALFIAVNFIANVGFIWEAGNSRWPQIIATVVGFVIAGLVWFGSERIADEIMFDADELRPEDQATAVPRPAADRVGLAAIAFGVAGVVFAAIGGVHVSHTIVRIIIRELGTPAEQFLDPSDGFFVREDIASVLSSLVRVGIGFALFWFRGRLAAALVGAPPDASGPNDGAEPSSAGPDPAGSENIWDR